MSNMTPLKIIGLVFQILLTMFFCFMFLCFAITKNFASALFMLLAAVLISPILQATGLMDKKPVLRGALQILGMLILFIVSIAVYQPNSNTAQETLTTSISETAAPTTTATELSITQKTTTVQITNQTTEATTKQTTVQTTKATTEPATEATTEPTTEPTTEKPTTEPPTEPPTTAAPTTVPTEPPTQAPTISQKTYVLNTNTMKFHKPTCSSVKDISPENYCEYTGTYDDVIAKGYVPCKRCNPY